MSKESSEQVKYLILDKVHKLSEHVIHFSSKIQCLSSDTYSKTNSTWNVFSRSALARLHEQAVTYHKSIYCLCENGFAINCGPLLRTMIELYLNAIVIVDSDSEHRAFRWFTYEILKSGEKCDQAKLNHMYSFMSNIEKKRAEEYIGNGGKDRYWYDGIYKGPIDVIKKKAPSLLENYNFYGSSVHACQIGYKIFDFSLDHESIEPRDNPYSANIIALMGAMFLVDFCGLRDQYEKLDLGEHFNRSVRLIGSLKDEIEALNKK